MQEKLQLHGSPPHVQGISRLGRFRVWSGNLGACLHYQHSQEWTHSIRILKPRYWPLKPGDFVLRRAHHQSVNQICMCSAAKGLKTPSMTAKPRNTLHLRPSQSHQSANSNGATRHSAKHRISRYAVATWCHSTNSVPCNTSNTRYFL